MNDKEIIKGLMGVIDSQKQTISVLLKRLEKAENPPVFYSGSEIKITPEQLNAVSQARDDWIEWNGGECPVDGDTVVEVERRGGHIKIIRAGNARWSHANEVQNPFMDIIRYRVVGETNE